MRVPDFIYKVILGETPRPNGGLRLFALRFNPGLRFASAVRKMIAFIAPNRDTEKRPWQLAVTVDEVEEATGLDFFGTMEKDEQERLESAWDLKAWGIGGA